MLKNYLKIAWRKLKKQKLDSAISIGGLAIGIACCLLLALSVRFELTYDNFHNKGDRLFRITTTDTTSGGVRYGLINPYPMAAALKSTYPEIKNVVRLNRAGIIQVKQGNKFYNEIGAIDAGPAFFQMFSFPLIAGNKSTALSDPNSIVISVDMAQKLFGTIQALGEIVTFRKGGEERSYKVTGVMKNVPANSSMQFDIVLPFDNAFLGVPKEMENRMRTSWYVGNSIVWVVLKKGASAKKLEQKLSGFLENYMSSSFVEDMTLGLQPISEVYFSQKFGYGVVKSTNLQYTLILAMIALIILGIAGMNFISFTLTRISGRHSEIGIRKASGALKKQLRRQLFGEILITCGMALILGIVLAELLSPLFREIIQKPLPPHILANPESWLLIIGILISVTFITWIYPAWVINSHKASELFGTRRSAERIPKFVKGIIVAQFALSIAFLIMTVTMQKQMNLFLNKDLGFNPDHLISINFSIRDSSATRLAQLYSREARQVPGVQNVALTGTRLNLMMPYGEGMSGMMHGVSLKGFNNAVTSLSVDEYYLPTMDIELIKGRNFSRTRSSEIENGIIINEQFAEALGWKNPVGRVIKNAGGETWESTLDGKKIIGVVEDFNFDPLYKKLKPIFLRHIESTDISYAKPSTILVKVKVGSAQKVLKKLSAIWKQLLPQQPFKYKFMNDLLASQYKSEKRWSTITNMASALTIFLACFGLFGLAALAVQRRTKEIGIRKVLGATVTNIVGLLSKDFLKLVLIGFLIAIPIAYLAMNKWLQNFAYRIDIGVGIFLLAGTLAVIIALATVSWQSVRAALANPVNSLRSE